MLKFRQRLLKAKPFLKEISNCSNFSKKKRITAVNRLLEEKASISDLKTLAKILSLTIKGKIPIDKKLLKKISATGHRRHLETNFEKLTHLKSRDSLTQNLMELSHTLPGLVKVLFA